MPPCMSSAPTTTVLVTSLPTPWNGPRATKRRIAWLQETFVDAEQHHSVGVLLVIQANPGFDAPSDLDPVGRFAIHVRSHRTTVSSSFLRTLRAETIAFGKPVVLIHGDSHYFRIDKPAR